MDFNANSYMAGLVKEATEAKEYIQTVKKVKWLGIYSYETKLQYSSTTEVHVECAFAVQLNNNTVEFRTFPKDSMYVRFLLSKMNW